MGDIRYGLRLLRKSPGFTIVAILTLALGIGANTAIFSTVDALLIRALPYADPDRVVMLWENIQESGFPRNTPSPGNYVEWGRRSRAFAGIAATRGAGASLTGDGQPEQLVGRAVTPNFFSVLGARPATGRTFTDDENQANAPVVVISDGLWRRRYAADPAIVGKMLLLNSNRYEVIGVMPRGFVFRDRLVDYWVPIAFTPAAAADRGSHYLNVVARLAPGVTLEAARDDMRRVTTALREQFGGRQYNYPAVVVPIKEELLGNTAAELLILMAAAAAVLLIACANLASLLLSQAVGRRGELAVRAALGASRGRLVGQMLVEATMFSLAGGALGLLVAPLGISVIAQLTPRGFPPQAASILDVRVLGFTLIVSMATGILFSVVPAIHAARGSLRDAMQQGSRSAVGGQGRLTRDALVVLQVAAALVLLVGAGLMLRTLANLRAIDIGFRSDHVLTMRTSLPSPRYKDPGKRIAFYDRVIAGVRALPGVENAAYGSILPFMAQGNTIWFGIEGGTSLGAADDALYRVGTNAYLQTLGVQVVEGRLLDDRDGADAPLAVVVNETLARIYWPGASALGHRLRFGNANAPLFTVVGVVKDVHERGYQLAMKPGVYLAFVQTPSTWAIPENLVVRAHGRPEELTEPVRRIIASADPDQPVAAVRTMDEIVDLDVADRRQQMVLLGGFAALALLLASIGLYGVLSYAVTQRSRELGLRIALGASTASVARMVVTRGLALAGVGLAIGIVLAWAATRAMQNLLFGVTAADPWTFAAVVALLGTIALLASYVPARRASRLDPIAVLRAD